MFDQPLNNKQLHKVWASYKFATKLTGASASAHVARKCQGGEGLHGESSPI